MSRCSLLFCLLWGFFASLAFGTPSLSVADQERVAQAREARFPHYGDRLAQFLEDTPRRPPGGVVFLGDSITEGFALDAAFANRNVINRGIGGDTIEGLMDRLDVSVRDLAPKRVHLLIGINDIVGKPGVSVEEFAAMYEQLLHELKEAAPDAEIVVQSILPVRGRLESHNVRVRALNQHIRRLSEENGLSFCDLYQHVSDEDGSLRSEYTMDDIHLTLEGYWAWLEAIAEPAELFAAAVGLAPRWTSGYADSVQIDAVNPVEQERFPGGRGSNQLILFTPAAGRSTTGTNPWGLEAVVVNGKVAEVGGNDSVIPADGFVVSANGTAARWILLNLQPDVPVEVDGMVLQRGELAEEGLQARDRLRRLRYLFIAALERWLEGGKVIDLEADAQLVAADLQRLGAPGGRLTDSGLNDAAEKIEALRARLEEPKRPGAQ